MEPIAAFAGLLLDLLSAAVIIRALLSWVFYAMGRQEGADPFSRVLVQLTEPLLAPVRTLLMRILPIPIDVSPIIVILLIQFLHRLLNEAVPHAGLPGL